MDLQLIKGFGQVPAPSALTSALQPERTSN